jgi:diguanylate cyclase (GGDEF)-like protein
MNFDEVLETVERVLLSRPLSSIERFILHQSWLGKAYTQMAEDSSYCSAYIKTVGSQLWQDLSEALGEKVTKKNLHVVWNNYLKKQQQLTPSRDLSPLINYNKGNDETSLFRSNSGNKFFHQPVAMNSSFYHIEDSFEQHLQKQWEWAACYQTALSLILCKIDFFRKYQEIYGRAIANDCLKEVTTAIKSCVNRPTDLVILYRHEQIAVILPNTDNSGSIYIGKKIRARVKELGIANSFSSIQPPIVTVSIGIASTIPQSETNFITLVDAAKEALYLSQNQGCDRVTLQPISSI